MASQADKLKIGLFVVVGLAMGAGLLIWLGASRYFERTRTVVAYFEESVQGLQYDSPVKFRGVSVGRVKSIRMAPDKKLIEVVMNLDQNFDVTKDLGITMNLLGLTGKKYLEMDRYTKEPTIAGKDLKFEPRYPVIPTYASGLGKIENALDIILEMVNAVDFEKISKHLGNVSEKLDRILGDPSVENLGKDAVAAVQQLQQVVGKINREVDRMQLGRRVPKTLDSSAALLQEVTETTRSANRLIWRTDNNINRLSTKFERSLDHLEDFMLIIKRKPSTLFYGKPEKKEGE